MEPSDPSAGDVPAWSELIAECAARGQPAKDIRKHLKLLASSAWQLANWLTHARNALHIDAELVVSAVRRISGDSCAAAIVRRESKRPDRCPKCSSSQLDSQYAPELDREPPYVVVCGACGWEDPAPAAVI